LKAQPHDHLYAYRPVRVSNDALEQVRTLIPELYGADYLPEKPNFYQGARKTRQDAHEAFVPQMPRALRIPSGNIWMTNRSSCIS